MKSVLPWCQSHPKILLEKKTIDNIPYEYWHKNPQQNVNNPNSAIH